MCLTGGFILDELILILKVKWIEFAVCRAEFCQGSKILDMTTFCVGSCTFTQMGITRSIVISQPLWSTAIIAHGSIASDFEVPVPDHCFNSVASLVICDLLVRAA